MQVLSRLLRDHALAISKSNAQMADSLAPRLHEIESHLTVSAGDVNVIYIHTWEAPNGPRREARRTRKAGLDRLDGPRLYGLVADRPPGPRLFSWERKNGMLVSSQRRPMAVPLAIEDGADAGEDGPHALEDGKRR